MTVEDPSTNDNNVACQWFDVKNRLQRHIFCVDCLIQTKYISFDKGD